MTSRNRWWTVGATVQHRKTQEKGQIKGFKGGNVGEGKLGKQEYRVKWANTGKEEWISRKELKYLGVLR